MINIKTLAIFAGLFSALPTLAQVPKVYLGDTTQNGNLETGALTPFSGVASSAVTTDADSSVSDHPDFAEGYPGGTVMKVDLTANNGEGQWKLLTTDEIIPPNDGVSGLEFDIEADVDAGLALAGEMWVYVPSSAKFGTTPNAALTIQMEGSKDGGATFEPWPDRTVAGTSIKLDLTAPEIPRDQWFRHRFAPVLINEDYTHVYTRAWLVETVDTVNGKNAGLNMDPPLAEPADWVAAGYEGSIYIDNFRFETTTPPDPSVVFCEDIRNADMEALALAPWAPSGNSGSVERNIVHSGSQSMSVDMSITGQGNQWKGLNNNASAPAAVGDRIQGEAYVYVPSETVFGGIAQLNFEIRSDARGDGIGGNGQQGGGSFNLTTSARDVWVPFSFEITLREGNTTSLSSINTGGWNIQTIDPTAEGADLYSGLMYLDDVKLINIGPAEPGVLVDATTNNGDLEGPDAAPWNFRGAGTTSTDQNHTPDGSQSLAVDLTYNNNNQQWKAMVTGTSLDIDTGSAGLDRMEISAWVYIPESTTFGEKASLNFPVFPEPRAGQPNYGQPSIDLTTAEKGKWIEVKTDVPLDISGSTAVAINNWNLETIKYPNDTDGDGNADNNANPEDPTTPSTPADWIAAGYEGVFYIDDINVRAFDGTPGPDVEITSVVYKDGDGPDKGITITYNSSVGEVDIYYSENGLEPDDFEIWDVEWPGGVGQTYTDPVEASEAPRGFYFLVPTGTDPFPVDP